MSGELIEIRGKKLYVECYGQNDKPPVLYLHGGPGESCHDFSYHQSKKLGEHIRLIAIDQRGVCRSEIIRDNEEFGLNDLIEDCEALRNHFNIEKWSVIGHSFGGFLSLLYVSKYPNSIDKVIFEGPTFDFELTSRSLIRKTAKLLKKHGKPELHDKGLTLAESNLPIRELTEKYMELSDELGENRMEIYRHNHSNPTDYYSFHSEEEWEEFYDRSEIHFNLLREEGKIFDSLLPKIKEVTNPMLLAIGKYDAATCEKHIEVFKKDAINGETYVFEYSGHTPHYEEADKFKDVIVEFLSPQ
ncbi:alpha/beta hydrolase [Fictibacillus macauensis ZFHKF-1]|uniref:Alpha/beta hydrolase n=1 Tax=Fictibacillus macauensis ZFHKF-1 TaxID=1196324 RepID=I8AET9_9BACL|nr:alpha/beta hydrolase [Fictibacillus macauensis]EIT84112.1 alpha/beta hydrolase [Fictibacillus macauensis ZFHKF-1]